jgi:hypothetical protein
MLDLENGIFRYYGDNKQPGHDLHSRRGNVVLKNTFTALHTGKRNSIPPFFVFTQGPSGRDVVFRGLAVPGAIGLSQHDDLVAIWKTRDDQRFQNYKATFTILAEPTISREWLDSIRAGILDEADAPIKWRNWRKGGAYQPLLAPRSLLYRTRQQQIPEAGIQKKLIAKIVDYFKEHPDGPYAFEKCAAEIARLMDSNIVNYDLTRPWRDGGRDALGIFRIGHGYTTIDVEFALEAKCYQISNGCGIRETSRLISRLRHRQFGIFVTTSYVSQQAYQEIIEDGHPVVILSAVDIAGLLIEAGYSTVESLTKWLTENFPSEST